MDFSYLTNDFEVYRNKVIEVNKRMYDVQTLMKDLSKTNLVSKETRQSILKEYLDVQNELNELYRQNISY